MIHIFSENGSPSEVMKASFRKALSVMSLDSFKRSMYNEDANQLVDWYFDNKTQLSADLQLFFIPYLIYLLSSVNPILAGNFLSKYVKRGNVKSILLENLVLLKFEDYIGVDIYFLSDCLIEEFSMLSNNVDNYNFKNCHIKKLEVDEDWDTDEIVDHFKALGTTIDEIIEI